MDLVSKNRRVTPWHLYYKEMYVLVYATKTKLQHLFDKGAVVGEPTIQYFIFINGWANEHWSITKTQRYPCHLP